MDVGMMIFFDTITGEKIVNTGEWKDVSRKKTIDQQIATYKELTERNRETFDVIELEYGQYAQDFRECNGYRVNIEKLATLPEGEEHKALEFSYPEPNEPEKEPVYIAPLSEKVVELEMKNNSLTSTVDLILTEIIPSLLP